MCLVGLMLIDLKISCVSENDFLNKFAGKLAQIIILGQSQRDIILVSSVSRFSQTGSYMAMSMSPFDPYVSV